MNRFLVFFIVLFICQNLHALQKPVKVNIDVTQVQNLKLSEIASETNVITLPSTVIQNHVYIKKVLVTEQSVLVSYRNEKDTVHATSVYHFDHSGRFLGQIGIKRAMLDVFYNSEEQTIGLAYSNKISFYNLEGNFVKSLPEFDKKHLFYQGKIWGTDWTFNGTYWKYTLSSLDPQKNEVTQVHEFEDPIKEIIGIRPDFSINKDGLYVSYRLDHKIYKVGNKVKAVFDLKFKTRDRPRDRYLGPYQFVLGRWLFYGYKWRNKYGALVYDTNTGQSRNLQTQPNEHIFSFVEDDLVGDGYVEPKPLNQANRFYFIKDTKSISSKTGRKASNSAATLVIATAK